MNVIVECDQSVDFRFLVVEIFRTTDDVMLFCSVESLTVDSNQRVMDINARK
jgi:hypothetical protein